MQILDLPGSLSQSINDTDCTLKTEVFFEMFFSPPDDICLLNIYLNVINSLLNVSRQQT